MLFEILAVLILTFFASLGMIEASRWLLRQSTKCRMKKRVFYIAEAGSVPENIPCGRRSRRRKLSGAKLSSTVAVLRRRQRKFAADSASVFTAPQRKTKKS